MNSFRLALSTLALAMSNVACSEPVQPIIGLSDLDLDVVFLFSFGVEGEFIDRVGPVVLGDDLDGPTKVELQIGAQVVAAGWTLDALEAATPLFDAERVSTLELTTGDVSGCPNGRVDVRGTQLEIDLPPTQYFSMDADAAPAAAPEALVNAIASSAVLRLEVNAEACPGSADRTFQTFGTEEFPLPPGTVIDGRVATAEHTTFTGLAWVDDSRVAAVAGRWLMLVERGVPFVADSAHAAFLEGAGGTGVAVEPLPANAPPNTPIRVVAVGRDPDPKIGVIWDFDAGPDGLKLVETISLDVGLVDVTINPDDGRLVALGVDGSIHTQPSRGAPLDRVVGVLSDTGSSTTLGRTGWNEPAFAAAGSDRGVFVFGNRSADKWEQARIGLSGSERHKGIGFGPGPDGKRLWIGSNRGRLTWLTEGGSTVEPHAMYIPPSFDCGSPEPTCGWQQTPTAIRRIASANRLGVESLYLGISECAAVIETRVDGTCTTFLRFPGRALTVGVDERGVSYEYRELAVRKGWLALAARTGALYLARVGD